MNPPATLRPGSSAAEVTRQKNEQVSRSNRKSRAVTENEIDRAASAVEQFRVIVLVLPVAVTGCVRPPVDITSLLSQRSLDRTRFRRRGPVVPTVLDLHGCHDATVRVGVVYPHQEIGDDPARIT